MAGRIHAGGALMKCNRCAMVSIQGHACHEFGCPNANKVWSADRQAWIKVVECRECGSKVEKGEVCCEL